MRGMRQKGRVAPEQSIPWRWAVIQREGSAHGVLETFCASAEVRVSRRNSKLSTGLMEGGGSCRIFWLKIVLPPWKRTFFHSMQYSSETVRPGNWFPGKTLVKKPFLLIFSLQQHLKCYYVAMSNCIESVVWEGRVSRKRVIDRSIVIMSVFHFFFSSRFLPWHFNFVRIFSVTASYRGAQWALWGRGGPRSLMGCLAWCAASSAPAQECVSGKFSFICSFWAGKT